MTAVSDNSHIILPLELARLHGAEFAPVELETREVLAEYSKAMGRTVGWFNIVGAIRAKRDVASTRDIAFKVVNQSLGHRRWVDMVLNELPADAQERPAFEGLLRRDLREKMS